VRFLGLGQTALALALVGANAVLAATAIPLDPRARTAFPYGDPEPGVDLVVGIGREEGSALGISASLDSV
jgi:hypothetical protein